MLIVSLPAVVLVPLAAFWEYAYLSGFGLPETLFITIVLMGVALVWFLYQPAVQRPLSGASTLRGVLRAGSLPAAEAAYLEELARYKETVGIKGQMHSDIARAYAYGVIYLASYFVSLALSVWLYVPSGPLAAVLLLTGSVWIGIVCFWLFLRRLKQEAAEAKRLGYRLKELRSALAKPQPQKPFRKQERD